MKIVEMGSYQEESIVKLKDFYEQTGSCPMNGYLGEDLDRLAFDEEGNFYYSTVVEGEDMTIQSRGVLYGDNLLVKQKTTSYDSKSYALYSWDIPSKEYTLLEFDYSAALNRFFDVIKRFGVNLCQGDVSSLFKEMGLTFDNVTQIRLNQSINPMDFMFEEEKTDGEGQAVL